MGVKWEPREYAWTARSEHIHETENHCCKYSSSVVELKGNSDDLYEDKAGLGSHLKKVESIIKWWTFSDLVYF